MSCQQNLFLILCAKGTKDEKPLNNMTRYIRSTNGWSHKLCGGCEKGVYLSQKHINVW